MFNWKAEKVQMQCKFIAILSRVRNFGFIFYLYNNH